MVLVFIVLCAHPSRIIPNVAALKFKREKISKQDVAFMKKVQALSVCLCLSVSVCVWLAGWLAGWLAVALPTCPSVCLCLAVCVFMSVCLAVFLSSCCSSNLSVCQPVCLFVKWVKLKPFHTL